MTSRVRTLSSEEEIRKLVDRLTTEKEPITVLCRCREVNKFVAPFSDDVIVSLSPQVNNKRDDFTEVNEALRALMRTTEELDRKSCDEDRRDSGVSVRMHSSHGCSSTSDSSNACTSRDPAKMSGNDAIANDSDVFIRAAMAQKLKVSPFALTNVESKTKTIKTKMATLAPVAKNQIKGEFKATQTSRVEISTMETIFLQPRHCGVKLQNLLHRSSTWT